MPANVEAALSWGLPTPGPHEHLPFIPHLQNYKSTYLREKLGEILLINFFYFYFTL